MKDLIAEHGVVGGGGAGFPTAVKLSSRADTAYEVMKALGGK